MAFPGILFLLCKNANLPLDADCKGISRLDAMRNRRGGFDVKQQEQHCCICAICGVQLKLSPTTLLLKWYNDNLRLLIT
jgi:hypothetical protein